jgi:integrase
MYFETRATCTEWGTFFLRYKDDNGKTCHQKLGRSCDITLKQSRDEARRLRAEIQLGANPRAEARAKKQVITWNMLFTDYYAQHSQKHLRSYGNLEEMHRLRISPKFGNLPLNKFTRHAVQQFHNELRDEGLAPSTCDHHLKLIRQALNLAVEWDLIETNPVSKVKLFHVDNREERLMSPDDLHALMGAIERASERRKTVCLAVKLLLLTGSRVSELLHAKWTFINLKNKTWTIQATNSKSKKRRSVPLSDAAVEVLGQLETEGKSEWLFTNVKTGNRLTTIAKSWQKIRQDAGLPNLRLHDLRHMHASMLINSGQSLYVVQQILGHSDPSVTSRYAHLSTETLQDAANSVGDYLDKALKDKS